MHQLLIIFAAAFAHAPAIPAADARIIKDCSKAASDEEITVCGRRKDADAYRLPPQNDGFDPNGIVESVSRERHRLMEGGESGIGSCSATGAAGWTGCFHREVREKQQQGTKIRVRAGAGTVPR